VTKVRVIPPECGYNLCCKNQAVKKPDNAICGFDTKQASDGRTDKQNYCSIFGACLQWHSIKITRFLHFWHMCIQKHCWCWTFCGLFENSTTVVITIIKQSIIDISPTITNKHTKPASTSVVNINRQETLLWQRDCATACQ